MENMSNTGLTAGDILALTRDNDGGYGGWFWIIILFIFVFAFSGGMFGGNGVQAATTADLYSSIGSQNLMNDVRSGFASVTAAQCGTDKEILNNRYTTQLGFQNLSAQMSECCCGVKSTIVEDGEKTRALLTAQYEASLLEKINDLKAENSNLKQTDQLKTDILGSLGRFHIYPSCSCGYGCTGYNNLV